MIKCKCVGSEPHTDLGSNLRSSGYNSGGEGQVTESWSQCQPNRVTLVRKRDAL